MTIQEINSQIENIRSLSADDDEAAHSAEDKLREDFIRYLSEGRGVGPLTKQKAQLILSTNKINFARWWA